MPTPARTRLAAAAPALCLPLLLAFSGPDTPVPQDDGPEPAADLPSGDEVFARCLEAMGGAEKLGAVRSLHTKRTMRFGEAGEMEVETFAMGEPSFRLRDDGEFGLELGVRFLVRQNMPNGESVQGSDGELFWARAPGAPPRQMNPIESADAAVNAWMHCLPVIERLREHDRRTVARTEFDGVDCYQVWVDNGKLRQHAFYEVESGRLRGHVAGGGGVETRVVYSGWKEFGDLRFYTRLTIQRGDQKIDMEWTSIELDAVDEEVFDLPDDVRAMHEKAGKG